MAGYETELGWGYHKAPEGWTLIADQDDSAPYETDQTAIFKTPEGFVLATASGCSCWGGEWWVEEFATLDAIEVDLIRENNRKYKPSFKGTIDIVDEARKAIGQNKAQN